MNNNVLTREVELLNEESIRGIGQRIQEARIAKGVQAKDFADCLGIGKDQLSRIENGKVPCKLEYLYIIPQYLDVSIEYLVYGRTENECMKELNSILKGKSIAQLRMAIRVVKALFE